MNAQLNKAAEEKDDYLVSVTDGLACGAAFRVSLGQRLLVGSDLQADIVLPDPGACDCQLVLTGTDSGVVVEALAGKILLDGDTLALSTEINGADRRLRLGEAELWIQTPDYCANGEVSDSNIPAFNSISDAPIEPANKGDGSTAAFELPRIQSIANGVEFNETETLTSVPDLHKRAWIVPLAMVLGPLLVCGFYLSWKYSYHQNAPVVVPTLASVLEEPEFAGLNVSTTDDTKTLTGRLQSREQAKRLDVMLKALPEKIENHTHIADQLLAQINEIFRVNDETVKASFTANGKVMVETRVADPERLAHLREVVMRDVPELPGLVINNQPPPSALKPGKAPIVEPGKRVALVVSDEPAYVVTEDASRYFIGAILPSGHRIHAIEGGRVSLEMQGLITELKF